MDTKELVSRFPTLFHMAHPQSWNGIVKHGLLSTRALLDLYEVDAAIRKSIESARRPDTVVLEHPEHGTAYIRDNKPLSETKLSAALVGGASVAEFLRLINRKVFFWLTPQRLETLFSARAYRDREHLIITVDTNRLIDVYGESVTLSPINSGSTVYGAAPRGIQTFKTIAQYDFEERRKKRGPREAIAELAVEYAVPEILDFTVRSAIRYPDGSEETVYE